MTEAAAEAARMEFKIMVIGVAGVGKTSMLRHYTGQQEPLEVSVGGRGTFKGNVYRKQLCVDGARVTLELWNVNPYRIPDAERSRVYQGTHGAVFAFDLSQTGTYDAVELWHGDFFGQLSRLQPAGAPAVDASSLPSVLVGNKLDKHPVVLQQKAAAWAQRRSLDFLTTCAGPSEGATVGLDELFGGLARRCVQQALAPPAASPPRAEPASRGRRGWCPGWCPGAGCHRFCTVL
jgi:hypothetical protein